jgi:hypothetical protein
VAVAPDPVSGLLEPVVPDQDSEPLDPVGPQPVSGLLEPLTPDPDSGLLVAVGRQLVAGWLVPVEPVAGCLVAAGPEPAVTAKAVPPSAKIKTAAVMPTATSDRVRRRAPRMMVAGVKSGAPVLFAKPLIAFTSSSSKGVNPVQPEGRASFDVIGILPWAAALKGRRARGTDA